MDTSCLELGTDGRLTPVETEDATERWKRGDGVFWFASTAPDPVEQTRLLEYFGMDRETIQHILEPDHAARLLTGTAGVFFEFPTEVTGDAPETVYVDCVVVNRAVITFRPQQSGADFTLQPGEASRLRVSESSASALISALILASSVLLRSKVSRLKTRFLTLSRGTDEEVEDATRSELPKLKRELIEFDGVCDERIAILEGLEAVEDLFFGDQGLDSRFRVALSNTQHTARRLDRIDRRATDLQARIDSYQQEKMNRRLSRLTIISAIFLPLTLLAGIYGMNFEWMPELKWSFGYPASLGGMLLIAIGMYVWFRARGWME